MQNPKLEIRNPKAGRNPRAEPGSAGTPAGVSSARNAWQPAGRDAGVTAHTQSRRLAFSIRASDFFRSSEFGIRTFRLEDLNG
jgi:hypothetical protein